MPVPVDPIPLHPHPTTPSTATYPRAVKIFPTFHDYTDIIFAAAVNELGAEVNSVEKTLGINPFNNCPPFYTTFSVAIQDLWANKAPINHGHSHHTLDFTIDPVTGKVFDDHKQYILCDGSRPFTGAVGGIPAVYGNQLVTLGQVQQMGYITLAEAEFLIDLALSNLVTGRWSGSPSTLPGPPPPGNAPTYRLTGGVTEAVTNGNGDIWVSFGGAFSNLVQAFVATKMPSGWAYGHPPVPWIEAQLTLWSINITGCWCRFSHDYGVRAYENGKFSWFAIGY